MRKSCTISFISALLLAFLMCGLIAALCRVPYLDLTLSAPLMSDERRQYSILDLNEHFGRVDGGSVDANVEGLARLFMSAETDATVASYVKALYGVAIAAGVFAILTAAMGFCAVFTAKKPIFVLAVILLSLTALLALALWVGGVYAGRAIEQSMRDAFATPNKWISALGNLFGLEIDKLAVSVNGWYYIFTPITIAGFIPMYFLTNFSLKSASE